MAKGKTRTITIRIDEALYNEIDSIRAKEDRNMNQQLVNFIKLGKERFEKQKKVIENAEEDDVSPIIQTEEKAG